MKSSSVHQSSLQTQAQRQISSRTTVSTESQKLTSKADPAVVGESSSPQMIIEGQTTRPILQTEDSSSIEGGRSAWSDSLTSVLELPSVALPQHLILGMIRGGILFTAIVGAWSWFGTIEEASFAQGQLAPKGDVYKIQPPINGEVTKILVGEGDHVEQGQIIAEIDRQLLEKEIERLEQSLSTYQLKLGQTQSLIQQTESELNTLQAIAKADIAARQSSITQEAIAIETHEQILAQLQIDRQAQIERITRLTELVQKGAFAEDRLYQLEETLRARDRSITETHGAIEQSKVTIARLESERAQTQAMAHKHELETQQKLQQLHIEVTDLASNVNDTKLLLDRSKTELAQATLIAPVSGVISSLEIANIGEVMQPGQTFAEIAPGTAPLVLSTSLPSREAGLVEEGMPVNMKFDAFPYQDYGIVTGKVLTISPDARSDETLGTVYRVDIALDTTYINHKGKAIALKAGQTATAEIVINQRRLISVVLDPIRKLQQGNLSL